MPPNAVRISGSSKELKALASQMEKLAGKTFRTRVHKLMAHEALGLVHDGFEKGVDPYGRPWQPLKRKRARSRRVGAPGGGVPDQPLRDTRRLESSFRITANSEHFTLDTNVSYAAVHQFGADISQGPRVQARNLRGNRFMSAADASKRVKASHRRLGVARTNISFLPGRTIHIPQRQFLPSQFNIGLKWRKALFDVVATERDKLLGR